MGKFTNYNLNYNFYLIKLLNFFSFQNKNVSSFLQIKAILLLLHFIKSNYLYMHMICVRLMFFRNFYFEVNCRTTLIVIRNNINNMLELSLMSEFEATYVDQYWYLERPLHST